MISNSSAKMAVPAGKAPPLLNRSHVAAFAAVTTLFFMWALANNLNDILIRQFQKALDLTRMESGLVQSAFYFGYFTCALPAGWLITKVGYKKGILVGLGLYAGGAMMFYPAAELRSFGPFLFALYVIAAGLAILETAANPLITKLGPAESAAQRLNLAQSFNGFGAFLAPFIGGALIFSGIEHSPAERAAMPDSALLAWRVAEAKAVQLPYLGIALAVLVLAAIIAAIRFPVAVDQVDEPEGAQADRSIWSFANLRWAIVAQFFYVGAQVSVWSYFINFAQDVVHVGEKDAAHYLGFSLMIFMIGRFVGTALLRLIPPGALLITYGLIAASLCGVAMFAGGWLALGALGMTSFFMSVMFPTIFALGVSDLGGKTKIASSLLIMTIVGGAIIPPMVGLVADRTHSMQVAMLLPLACFVIVAMFGRFVSLSKGAHA